MNSSTMTNGAGTRFGRLPVQMANFLDQAGGFGRAEHCTAESAAPRGRASSAIGAKEENAP